LLAPTNTPLSGPGLYSFFGGIVALMAAIVVLVRSNRGVEQLVRESTFARLAFGLDVTLFSLAIAGMMVRFFILNSGGYKGYHLLRYVAIAIVAVVAVGCAILGMAVAANVSSPKALFALLRHLNSEQEAAEDEGLSKE